MRHYQIWLALGAIALGGWLIARNLDSGDRSAAVREEELPKIVFVCRESGEIFIGTARTTPALHPVTEKATLMAGVYDTRQKKWVVGPPLEEWQRLGNQVKSTLSRTGPIPENTSHLPAAISP